MANSKATNRPNRNLSSKENKPRRTSLSSGRNILNVKGLPKDKIGRWVNDTDTRISDLLERGYTFVEDDTLSIGDPSVDSSDGVGSRKTKNVGGGVTAYFMVQDKEHYAEDRKYVQDQVDSTESSLRQQSNDPSRYGKIDITSSK